MEADRQEVGIYRERIIVGFLLSKLGGNTVKFPEPDDTSTDVLVAGVPLQIKTVTGNGEVTAKWTADTASAREVIGTFSFNFDLWLVRIWWEKNEKSVFYVPREVLQETVKKMPGFLRSSTGTNNRGVKVKRSFMKLVERDCRTTSVAVDWQWSGRYIPHPVVRYVRYWDGRDYTNPSDQ